MGCAVEQTLRDALMAYGMDVDATLLRYGGNEALLLRHLLRFPQEQSFAALQKAMDEGAQEAVQAACHSLKGVSGNLGLTPLYAAASRMMACLRATDAAGAGLAWRDVETAYRSAVALLEAMQAPLGAVLSQPRP